MARVLNIRQDGVTRGVLGRDAEVVAELVEVTFEDELGIPHTVFAHKDGPWQTVEEIIKAWGNHELHSMSAAQVQAQGEHVAAPEPPAPAGWTG